MKIWLSKNSEIPVREQLITQIALGIASGDLKTGERLPSTREIARRFGVHSNTVGFAYQKLSEQGLIEFKKGSGFFVCEAKPLNHDGKVKLERLIADFFHSARSLGFSSDEIQKQLKRWFSAQPPDHFLVIESDEKLREILIEEIRQATGWQVRGVSFEEFQNGQKQANAIFAAMIDETPKIEPLLAPDKTCLFLKSRSVPDSMQGEQRPEETDLIAVVSGWNKFLLWAKTFLIAARVENDSIVLRSTVEDGWQKGLKNAAMIICDSVSVQFFPNEKRARVFRVISDDSIKKLKEITGDK